MKTPSHSRGMRWGVLAVALTLGCVSPSGTVDPASTLAPADWASMGASLFVEHDHTDRAQHADMAHGLVLAAASPLSEDARSLGEYTEADAANGLVAVSVALTGGATLALLDATALPDIKVLSTTWEPGAYGDVKLDDELPLLYHAHTGGDRGFSIWDVSDPTKPARVGEGRGPGCHMLHPQRIDGVSYVWCAGVPTTTLYRVDAIPTGGYVAVQTGFALPLRDLEVARYATYYGKLLPPGASAAGVALVVLPHDMTAQADPLTGAPIVAVASELQGIRVFDVSIPQAPREIAHWRGEGLDAPIERVHTVVLHKIGERRVAFAATETFNDEPAHYYIVDMTDWAAPALLHDFVPPGIEHDDSIRFSAHNLNVAGDRAYLANFHGGLWVLDVSDPSAPEVIAHRVSARDTGYPEAGRILIDDVAFDENAFWDVIVVNGYALVTDMPAGIEVLAVDGDPHGDPAYASVG